MRWARLLLGTLGVVTTAYGVLLLLDRPADDLVGAAEWAVGGLVLHDFVLGPLVLLAGFAIGRVLPHRVRGPAAVGFVVLGTVTVMAVPVLGRFGAIAANPSLLDRDYRTGWLVLAGLTLAGVAVGSLVSPRRQR